MKTLNFGLIGAGAIAKTHVDAFARRTDCKLVGVADVNLEAASKLASQAEAKAFSSAEELLNADVPLHAAVICTPPSTHEEIAVACVNRGLHVLCEKPFAVDSLSARRMVRAAVKADVILTMASKFRYTPDVAAAKQIIDQGMLGEILLLENVFASRVDMRNRWNAQPAVSGGGVLVDNGAHSVDLLRYFLGPLAEVNTVEGKRVQSLAVEDTVRVFVRSRAGVVGSIDLSWSMNKEVDAFLSFYGSEGVLHVGWKGSRYRLGNSGEWTTLGKGYDKVEAFSRQLGNFCAAIREEEALVIGPDDAIASVDAIEAAYRSLRRCRWTSLKAPRRRKPAEAAA
jgi:predicted dehydrogenase